MVHKPHRFAICPGSYGLAHPSIRAGKHLLEIGNDVTAKQLDRVHNARVRQIPHLHEAENLIYPGFLIFLQHLDDRIGIAHGEGTGFQVILQGLTSALLLDR